MHDVFRRCWCCAAWCVSGFETALGNAAAAMTIQRALRRVVARRRLIAKVRSSFEKVFDDASQRYFYYNKRTGRSQWTKPKVLGAFDIPVTEFPEESVRSATPRTPAPGADAHQSKLTGSSDAPAAVTATATSEVSTSDQPVLSASRRASLQARRVSGIDCTLDDHTPSHQE